MRRRRVIATAAALTSTLALIPTLGLIPAATADTAPGGAGSMPGMGPMPTTGPTSTGSGSASGTSGTSGATSASPTSGTGTYLIDGPQTAQVQIESTSYSPNDITILTGDTVEWADVSTTHTVSADDNTWSSGYLFDGSTYQRRFTKPGTVTYHCRIHSFMTGTVRVTNLLLTSPAGPLAPNKQFPLRGRAAAAAGEQISIEADSGTGFQQVATTTVAADGSFTASVTPNAATTAYRAVDADATSSPIAVTVLSHKVSTSAHGGHRTVVSVAVTPAAPGATVVLYLYLRERFGWWPQLTARLNRSSHARFVVNLGQRVQARVALTLPDGATQLALGRTIRIGPSR